MNPLGCLALAGAAFVGTHVALSHPLRAWLVARIGERGFLRLYSLVALVTLVVLVRSYGAAADAAPVLLWDPGHGGWVAATLLMWVGSVLFAGSLRRNPAFPHPGAADEAIGAPHGVFAITRHPMNWGFALWAVVHIIANPNPASLILSVAILVLALGGSALQDHKKKLLLGPVWAAWMAQTAFVPFGKGVALPDGIALAGGTLLWLAATWAHGALGYRAAGVWVFLA